MSPTTPRRLPQSADLPTPKQGQFLAYIQEYMLRNSAGVAPPRAVLQRFFNLTAPSVNSMLIRLEQRGFICRTPGKARGITLVIDPGLIPELDCPFRG
jgi:DNA-binding MarR family transcriptional regulator